MSFLPKQARYIVGTEACERFNFYGLKSILTLYMVGMLGFSQEMSISVVHLFVAIVYLTPLIGAWLSDKVWGRYKTILYVSLLYCVGNVILALADLFQTVDTKTAVLFLGLFVIGLGSGGIKPCVSSFLGDQIPNKDEKMMTRAYNVFYWSINLGSLFSFLVIPAVRNYAGWSCAFAVPGIFMGLATLCFWLGRKHYLMVPPTRQLPSHSNKKASIWKILQHVVVRRNWQTAIPVFGLTAVKDARQMFNILMLFIFIIPFWSLFDQTASSWVLQGSQMTAMNIPLPWGGTWSIGPAEIQSANPLLVMILVPLISTLIYPHIGKLGHPLVRMGSGIFLSALSFAAVAWIQARIDSGEQLSIAWQLIPYIVLTVSEILLSTTGLEFAYTQAPASMKSTIASFWLLTTFAGNLLVFIITAIIDALGVEAVSFSGFITYSTMALVVSICFAISAKFYAKRKVAIESMHE